MGGDTPELRAARRSIPLGRLSPPPTSRQPQCSSHRTRQRPSPRVPGGRWWSLRIVLGPASLHYKCNARQMKSCHSRSARPPELRKPPKTCSRPARRCPASSRKPSAATYEFRQTQKAFIERGLASAKAARKSGKYVVVGRGAGQARPAPRNPASRAARRHEPFPSPLHVEAEKDLLRLFDFLSRRFRRRNAPSRDWQGGRIAGSLSILVPQGPRRFRQPISARTHHSLRGCLLRGAVRNRGPADRDRSRRAPPAGRGLPLGSIARRCANQEFSRRRRNASEIQQRCRHCMHKWSFAGRWPSVNSCRRPTATGRPL